LPPSTFLSSPILFQATEVEKLDSSTDTVITSKLTQGDYTVTVNLSGNGVNVTNPSLIAITVDRGKPAQPAFSFEDCC
jgi:hypothetical protein